MNINNKEASKVLEALNAWFKSQSIDHVDAAFVCTLYVSTFIASYSQNEAAVASGLQMASETMKALTEARLKQKSEIQSKRNLQ
jgi:hypothetical protein